MAKTRKKSRIAKALRGGAVGDVSLDIANAFDIRSSKYWAGSVFGAIAVLVWKGLRR